MEKTKRGPRNELAKTGIRKDEKALIVDIANEWGVTQSEVFYIAILRLIREERPESGIPAPVLVV